MSNDPIKPYQKVVKLFTDSKSTPVSIRRLGSHQRPDVRGLQRRPKLKKPYWILNSKSPKGRTGRKTTHGRRLRTCLMSGML